MLSHHHEVDFRASSLALRLLRFSSGRRVLDAGCGTGRLTLELLRNGYEVVAVDHEEDMVELTNNSVAKDGFKQRVAMKISLENLDQLSSDEFDEIFCCDVIEHVKDDRRALSQLRDLLKPNGRLIITVPAWQFLFNERDERMGHYRRYSPRMLQSALRESDFIVEKTRWWNLSGFLLNALFIRFMKIKFSENFRYKKKGLIGKFKAWCLQVWFHTFENYVPVPVGLTLICIARKK